LCTTDSITDASEMEQSGERFIKSTFSVTAKAYLLPEYLNSVITNKVSNMKKQLTPSKIEFNFEGDASDVQVADPYETRGHINRKYKNNKPSNATIKKPTKLNKK
jgi:hypothetical protein